MMFKVLHVPSLMIGSSILVVVSLALASILPAIRASRLQIAEASGPCLATRISILRGFLLLFVIAFLVDVWPWWATPHRPPRPTPKPCSSSADTYRNGWPSFITRVKITNYESGKAGRRKTLRGLAEGHRQNLRRIHQPPRKGPPPADARATICGSICPIPAGRSASRPSNGSPATPRTATWRAPTTLPTTRPPIFAEEKMADVDCHVLELDGQAQRRDLPAHSLLGACGRCAARAGRVLSHLRQAHQVGDASTTTPRLAARPLLRRFTLYDEIRHNSHSLLEYSSTSART